MVLINLAIIFLLLMTSFTNGASNTRWQPVLIRKGRAVDLFPCQRPGFYRSLENCEVFFRCIRTSQYKEMLAYEFVCPDGLIFDERHEICNWPYLAPKCEAKGNIPNTVIMTGPSDPIKSRPKLPPTWEGHSTNEVTKQPQLKCKKSGFFKNNLECFKFYRCVLISSRQFYLYEFNCPQDTEFNEGLTTCMRVSPDSNCASEFKNIKRPTQTFKYKQGSTESIQNLATTVEPYEFSETTTQGMPTKVFAYLFTTVSLPTVTQNLDIIKPISTYTSKEENNVGLSRTTSLEESSTNINQDSSYETTSVFTKFSPTPLTEYDLKVKTLLHKDPVQDIKQHIIFPDHKYLSKVDKTSGKFQTSTLGTNNIDNLDHGIKIEDTLLDNLPVLSTEQSLNTTPIEVTSVQTLNAPKQHGSYLSPIRPPDNILENSKFPLSTTLPTIKTTHEEITTIQDVVTPKHHSTYLNKPLSPKTTIIKEEEINQTNKATTKMQLELTTGLDITHKPKVIRPSLPFTSQTLTEKPKTISDLPTDQPLPENIPEPDNLYSHGRQTKPQQISYTKLPTIVTKPDVETHSSEKYKNRTLSSNHFINKTFEISTATESQIDFKRITTHNYLPQVTSTESPANLDNVTVITKSNISEILLSQSHILNKENLTYAQEHFTNITETAEVNHTANLLPLKDGYTAIGPLGNPFELIHNKTTALPVTKGTISLTEKVHPVESNGTFDDNNVTHSSVDKPHLFQVIHNVIGLNASAIKTSHDDKLNASEYHESTTHISEAFELIKNETTIAPIIHEINLDQPSSNSTAFHDHIIHAESENHTSRPTIGNEITPVTLSSKTPLNITKTIILSNHSEIENSTIEKYEATTIHPSGTTLYNDIILPDKLHTNIINITSTIDQTLDYVNASNKPLDKTINQVHVDVSTHLNVSSSKNWTSKDTDFAHTTTFLGLTTITHKSEAFNLFKNETNVEPISYHLNLTTQETIKNESNIHITEDNLSTKKPTNASFNQSVAFERPSTLLSTIEGNLTIDTANITESTLNVTNIVGTSYEVKPTPSPIEVKPTPSPIEVLSSNTTHISEPFHLSYNETSAVIEQNINKTLLNEYHDLTNNLTQKNDHTSLKQINHVLNDSLEIIQNDNLYNLLINGSHNSTMEIFVTTLSSSSGNNTDSGEKNINDTKHNIKVVSTEPKFTITLDSNDTETDIFNGTSREAMEIFTDNGILQTNGKHHPNSIKFTGKVKHYGNITIPQEPFTVKTGIRVLGESSNIIEIIEEESSTNVFPVKSHPIIFVKKPHEYQSTHNKNKESSNDELYDSYADKQNQIEQNPTMEIIPNVNIIQTNITDPKLEIILKHSAEYPGNNHLPGAQTFKDNHINIMLPEDRNSIIKSTVDDRENQIKDYGISNEIFKSHKSYLKLSESVTSSPSTTKGIYIYEDEYDSELNSTETPEDWTLSIIPEITSRMLRRLVMNSLPSNQSNSIGPERYVLTRKNKNAVK